MTTDPPPAVVMLELCPFGPLGIGKPLWELFVVLEKTIPLAPSASLRVGVEVVEIAAAAMHKTVAKIFLILFAMGIFFAELLALLYMYVCLLRNEIFTISKKKFIMLMKENRFVMKTQS